jgi:hypothetical protein
LHSRTLVVKTLKPYSIEAWRMTKGVPPNPRACHRCGQSYQPTSGPQKYCSDCRPFIRSAYNKDWRKRHPDQRRLINRRAIANKPEYYRALKKYCHYMWRQRLRRAVFGHYSNNTFKCACCGESEQDFLVIDHIEGMATSNVERLSVGQTREAIRCTGGWSNKASLRDSSCFAQTAIAQGESMANVLTRTGQ